ALRGRVRQPRRPATRRATRPPRAVRPGTRDPRGRTLSMEVTGDARDRSLHPPAERHQRAMVGRRDPDRGLRGRVRDLRVVGGPAVQAAARGGGDGDAVEEGGRRIPPRRLIESATNGSGGGASPPPSRRGLGAGPPPSPRAMPYGPLAIVNVQVDV